MTTIRLPIEDEIPDELLAYKTWVCWRLETREGKPTKVPYSYKGTPASSIDKRTWGRYKDAVNGCEVYAMDGIGFVLVETQELIGIDLDKCVEDGKPDEWAAAILCRFPDTYAEITPSGQGLRLWLRGKLPEGRRRTGRFEIYSHARFLTVTGNRLPKRPLCIAEGGDALAKLYQEMFPPQEQRPAPESLARPATPLEWSDQELLDKAFSATNGSDIEALWNGDTSAHGGDDSAADCALCAHLAFYAGQGGMDTVDRLFRQSALFRPKWDKKHRSDGATYGEMTIEQAYKGISEFYEGESGAVELPAPTGQKQQKCQREREVSTKCQRENVDTSIEVFQSQNEPKNSEKEAKSRSVNAVNAFSEKGENQAENAYWQSLIPVREDAMIPFPLTALPTEIAEYVREVSRALHVPADMPALAALGTLSFACCRRFDVEVNPSYIEPTNLYFAITAEPGTRKSSTLEAIAFPLRHAEMDMALDGSEALQAMKERRAIQESEVKRKREEAYRTDDKEKREKLIDEITKMSEQLQAVPAAPRLLVEDVTPEKLVGLLIEQAGTLALISSEGGIFQIMGGRYSEKGESNLDLFLKAHDAESYRVDRMGRLPEFLPAARLMLCIMVQPSLLHSLNAKKEFRGRGLTARFLFGVPADLRGSRIWDMQDVGIDFALKAQYSAALRTLLKYPPKNAGNLFEHYHIALSKAAREIHIEGANDVERRQGPGGDLRDISDWASKLAGRIVRIAASLHAWKYREDRPEGLPVDALTMTQAWAMSEYLIAHAKRAFDMMTESDLARVVKKAADWIREKELEIFTSRECHRALQRHVKDAREVESALDILALNNYVKKIESKNESGRRVFQWEVNPEMFVQKPATE